VYLSSVLQDEDVRNVIALCENLKQLLQDIEDRISGSQGLQPSIIERLNGTLQTFQGHCDAVLRLAQKYAVAPATSLWRGGHRELMQKLKFPFENKTLKELKDIMMAFRANVDVAMGLLNL
jgi:hypothetical protein